MADVNTEWLKNLKLQIDAIPDCRALNKLIAWMREMFQQLIEDIINQIAKLIGLIIPPTSLAKIIKYLKNLATQYLGPYLAAIRQMVQMIKAFAEVLAAIQNKLANLSCSLVPAALFSKLKADLGSAAYKKLYAGNSTLLQLTSVVSKMSSVLPSLSVIAAANGVSVSALPALADKSGGTLPFMTKMMDKYQPAVVPDTPATPSITTPTTIPLDYAAPAIDHLSVGLGVKEGGQTITVYGSEFLADCTVTIGGESCTGISLVSSSELTCVTPEGGIGLPQDLVVTNTDGQSATLANAFAFY